MIYNKKDIRELMEHLRTEKTVPLSYLESKEALRDIPNKFMESLIHDLSERSMLNTAQTKSLVEAISSKMRRKLFHCENATDKELQESIDSYNGALKKSEYFKFIEDYEFYDSATRQFKINLYMPERERIHAGFRTFMKREHEDVPLEQVNHEIQLAENIWVTLGNITLVANELSGLIDSYEAKVKSRNQGTHR